MVKAATKLEENIAPKSQVASPLQFKWTGFEKSSQCSE